MTYELCKQYFLWEIPHLIPTTYLNRTEEFSDDGAVQFAVNEKLPDVKLYQMPPVQFANPLGNDDQVPTEVLFDRTCKSTVPFAPLIDAKVTVDKAQRKHS